MKSINILGLEGYLVDTDGGVYSKRYGRKLRAHINHKGYLVYWLYFGEGRRRSVSAHRAVALTYIDNPDNNPQVNHKDGDKTNNNVSNLEWCTNTENKQHAVTNKLVARNVNGNKNGNLQGERIHTSKLTEHEVSLLRCEDAAVRKPDGKLPYGSKMWAKWGIGKTQYNNIVKGNYWKHVAL